MSPVTVPVDNAFTLAACAEMIYLDKPFLERVDAIAARGLKVEIWDWTSKDLKTLAARRGDGVEIVSMTGYVEGDLTTDEGVARIRVHRGGLPQGRGDDRLPSTQLPRDRTW